MSIEVTPLERPRTRLKDFYLLTKPNLTALVVMTTLLGLTLAATRALKPSLIIATLLGTALSGGGACALNMLMESDFDRLMTRTQKRPLPDGRMLDFEAALLGAGLVSAGGAILWWFANPLTALLSLLAATVYIFVYTPMKRKTPMATIVGAIPGALPPMMGWTAVTGALNVEAWIVFAILFFWQLPHFWALAILFQHDYERGGFKLWPGDKHEVRTIHRAIVISTLLLALSSIALFLVEAAGAFYLCTAILLNVWFLRRALLLVKQQTRDSARALFLGSIVYLPALLIALVIDRPSLLSTFLGV